MTVVFLLGVKWGKRRSHQRVSRPGEMSGNKLVQDVRHRLMRVGCEITYVW